MTNRFRGLTNVKRAFLLLMVFCGLVQANMVTVTVTRTLPSYQQVVEGNNSCGNVRGPFWIKEFDPQLPAGALIVSSHISGAVDDQAEIIGAGAMTIGGCEKQPFSADITSIVAADTGAFTIRLFDRTAIATQHNEVSFSGINTVTFRLSDVLAPDVSDTNLEEEVCAPYLRLDRCEETKEETVCWYKPVGCSGCDSRGSPQVSLGLANFNVRVTDTPIWHETAVGAPLDLRLRFSNFGEARTNNAFGPKWSCNWESYVVEVGPGTNRMVFPSGSIALFLMSSNGVYLPPGALDGELVRTGALYRYQRPDGWCLEYAQSPPASNVYRLAAIRDAWSNTVSVTYTNGRLHRVQQTVPDTGRYLEFTFDPSGQRVTAVSTEPTAYRAAYFSYAADGYLTNVVDMGGFSYGFEYTNGYLARVLKGTAERIAVSYSATPNYWTSTNAFWVELRDAGGFTRRYTWEFGTLREEIRRGGTKCPGERLRHRHSREPGPCAESGDAGRQHPNFCLQRSGPRDELDRSHRRNVAADIQRTESKDVSDGSAGPHDGLCVRRQWRGPALRDPACRAGAANLCVCARQACGGHGVQCTGASGRLCLQFAGAGDEHP